MRAKGELKRILAPCVASVRVELRMRERARYPSVMGRDSALSTASRRVLPRSAERLIGIVIGIWKSVSRR